MAKTECTTINLPKSLVEELKVWRLAFCSAYGNTISYFEMLRGMLDSLKDLSICVDDGLDRLIKKHLEIRVIMGI